MERNNYTYINAATTTVIGPATTRRITLIGIQINKTLVGTVTVLSGATVIGVLAVGTNAGTYWKTSCGTLVQDLQITTSSASDDVTILWNNL